MNPDEFGTKLGAERIISVRDAWEGLHIFQTRQRQMLMKYSSGYRYRAAKDKILRGSARQHFHNKYNS